MEVGFDIHVMIKEKSFIVQYQSLLSNNPSFRRGLEAFVKGYDCQSGQVISVPAMFNVARSASLCKELNHCMVEKAMEGFAKIYSEDSDLFLFINVDATLIKEGGIAAEWLVKKAESFGLPVDAIAFDLLDYETLNVDEIRRFIKSCRREGFYICIDDIGKGFNNLDKILLYNPDVIKINVQYLEKLPYQDYRERLIKQMTHLAHELGILVVITGVEDERMLAFAYEQGVQYFQGYHIDRPKRFDENNIDVFLDVEKARKAIERYIDEALMEDARSMMNKLVMVLNKIREDSHGWMDKDTRASFEILFDQYYFIQSGWLVNGEGRQTGEAYINNDGFDERRAGIFRIYGPGHDYSDEQYYSILRSGALDVWITKPYYSLLNNQLCMKTTSYIEASDGKQYMLVLEVNVSEFSKFNVSALFEADKIEQR